MPHARRIWSILPRSMESKAFLKSMKTRAMFIRFGLESLHYATVVVFISDRSCVYTLRSILRSVGKWFRCGKNSLAKSLRYDFLSCEHLNLIHSDVTSKSLHWKISLLFKQKLCFQHRINCSCSKVSKTIQFFMPNILFRCVNYL